MRNTRPRHREEEAHNNLQKDKLSRVTKYTPYHLEWPSNNVEEIIERLQTPIKGVTMSNETTTTTESPAAYN